MTTNEVVRYVRSCSPAPTYRELCAHFRRKGRELLVVEISGQEIQICQQMDIAYFEEKGNTYAVATAEKF